MRVEVGAQCCDRARQIDDRCGRVRLAALAGCKREHQERAQHVVILPISAWLREGGTADASRSVGGRVMKLYYTPGAWRGLHAGERRSEEHTSELQSRLH